LFKKIAKVENGVTKSCQIFCGKKQKKTQFWPDFFHLFEQDRLLFARIGVTEFPQKQPKNKKTLFLCLRFFQKWVRIRP
tara:strand:- start:44 stop:280 length:237 start_codon:yes stop_codon:yes gene_type:complete